MTDAQQDKTRRHVIFRGRVQGVFFRATTVEISRGRAVVGYVRNLPDGTVELEAEGTPGEIDAFLADVRSRYAENISGVDEETIPARSDESSFDVR